MPTTRSSTSKSSQEASIINVDTIKDFIKTLEDPQALSELQSVLSSQLEYVSSPSSSEYDECETKPDLTGLTSCTEELFDSSSNSVISSTILPQDSPSVELIQSTPDTSKSDHLNVDVNINLLNVNVGNVDDLVDNVDDLLNVNVGNVDDGREPPLHDSIPDMPTVSIAGDTVIDNNVHTDLHNPYSNYWDNFIPMDLSNRLYDEYTNCVYNHSENGHDVIAYGKRYPYKGSKQSEPPKPFTELINETIKLISSELPGTTVQTCLVNRFTGPQSYMPEHSDNESVLCPNSSVITVSLGQERTIIYKNKTSKREVRLKVEHSSMYTMTVESNKHWTHRIDRELHSPKPRVSLVFFTLKNEPKCSEDPPSKPPHIKHLIFGDSLLKSVHPEVQSLTVCKGGAKICDIKYLIDETLKNPNVDILNVESVTLSVGTNNLTDNIPLNKVLNEYCELLEYIKFKFPKSRIGLFNVPPRFYPSVNLFIRIRAFNNFLLDLGNFHKNVETLCLFWEFIDSYGYMNGSLFRHDYLHFSHQGILLVRDHITWFQQRKTKHYV